ncbi:MAG: Holliday junction branch migration protein RuvA [Sphingobacteriales bacterium]|nr:Holliday junction branch migration protein RuvA [Sphingobacteriales bacterium]
MIAYIEGKLAHISPTTAIIECSGIGYTLHISLYTYEKIRSATTCRLYAHYYISAEQIPTLYGFADEAERMLFLELTSVSGVGTATARMILSTYSPDEVQRAIVGNNLKMLQAVKGVGPKAAQRLVLELKDRLAKTALPEENNFSATHNTFADDALQALSALGISKNQAVRAVNRALKDNPSGINSVQTLIKEALKIVSSL